MTRTVACVPVPYFRAIVTLIMAIPFSLAVRFLLPRRECQGQRAQGCEDDEPSSESEALHDWASLSLLNGHELA